VTVQEEGTTPEPERLFTVEEADALLGDLEPSLERIREARQVVLEGGRAVTDAAPSNGGGERGREYWDALGTLRRDVESVIERGVILRDPETGLIDFPARREGRDVFLCWRLGEERVMFWHSPDTGFGGRRPL
jgi:hypothetical protein